MRPSKHLAFFLIFLVASGGALASFVQAPEGAKKIFAQQLVDEALAKHPEVIVLAMHVTPPTSSDNIIIASNIGRIGKKADEDDTSVINTGKSKLDVNKKGDHFEVELVLQDQSGKTIGALGVVFKNEKGREEEFRKKAEQVRDEMRKRIPTIDRLFEPAA